MNNKQKKVLNTRIRRTITTLIANQGQIDTRVLINQLSKAYNTSKQRICGNISALKTWQGYTIIPNPPHSVIY
ncbi:MAG: hypothetical protein LIO40_05320 [Ruminococcus sp.]|nr:hypothetical protein [Ruminococcus sp.]